MAAESTLVLVLTDVEGSTRMWAERPAAMDAAMRRHHEIVHAEIAAHDGWRPVDQGEGDSVFAAFEAAEAALAAVIGFQRRLLSEAWPDGVALRVRVGVHIGTVLRRDSNLFGSTVNRAARLRSLGAGGQILLSAPVFELLRDSLPDGVAIEDLGEHRMRDLVRAERVYQVTAAGLPSSFPPLASLDRARHNLPVQTTSFIGRDAEVRDVAALVQQDRLVTVVGFGGIGKTRVALQAAAELAIGDGDGVWFVDLSTTGDLAGAASAIAAALGVREEGDGLDAVLRFVRDRRLLLVLDNLEHLLPEVAGVVDRLTRAGPEVRVLCTSREATRVEGERVVALQPLPVPGAVDLEREPSAERLAALTANPSVELFVERAAAARSDFVLGPGTAAPVAAIVARLDGLPLAIELVAARSRALSPPVLLARLERTLSLLTGGSRTLPLRQQTLRATIAWSTRSLEPEHLRLLQRLSVFPGSFTLDAAEAICGPSGAWGPEVDVFTGLLELVDRSLVRVVPDDEHAGPDRYGLLLPVREYAHEDLVSGGGDAELAEAHADHYLASVRLTADLSPADLDRILETVRIEWHNLRPALELLHDLGRASEVTEYTRVLTLGLDRAGRRGEQARLVRQTMTRLDDEDRSAAAVLLRLQLAYVEMHAGRMTEAIDALARARVLAEGADDPSVLVEVAYTNTALGDPFGLGPALVLRAGDALDASPERGGSAPRWLLRRLWEEVAIISGAVSGAHLERMEERLLASARGGEDVRLRNNFAWFALRRGEIERAARLLAPFTADEDLPGVDPGYRPAILLLIAEVRTAEGDPRAADRALRRVPALLEPIDAPADEAMFAVQRAAVDRLLGRPDRAADDLARLLSAPVVRGTLLEGQALWLLAVLGRERGDPGEARRRLRAAWEVARVESDPDLRWRCLMELAVQSMVSPAAALRPAAPAAAHRDHDALQLGPVYDLDAVLRRLEDALGAETVDDAVERLRGGPLELPAWDAATPGWHASKVGGSRSAPR